MKYRTEDLDVTRPLAPITLAADESGLGFLVRRGTLPVGYLLREAEPGATIPSETLTAWIAEELNPALLAANIADAIRPPVAASESSSLTVLICTRNRPETLERCLQALRSIQENHSFAILVVDNAPPDERTAELVQRWPQVRYVVEPRPGLDFARNRAWQEAESQWVAYLDDDAMVDIGWFAGLEVVWSQFPEAGAITGPILALELSTEAQILFEKRGGFRRGFAQRRYRDRLPGNSLYPAGAGLFGTGANMAFRRDILDRLGGFDEALDTGRPLPGGGDLDIFFRVIDAGIILVHEPRFCVWHEHRKTLTELQHQYYTWGLGLMAYVGKFLRRESPHRPLFRQLVRWWFRDQLRQIKECLRGRHPLPLTFLVAELWGGAVGLGGEYQRSQRRIQKIKHRHPQSS